ncbi:MAG: CBS domain-containing protein [Thaumarchaeota archaeon]|nr:CBS domain-containing protein [Nitrososphaerota archaeon]
MSLDVIHEHFEGIMKTRVGSLMSKPILIDPSETVAKTISKLTNSNAFDAFCIEDDTVLNVNIRDLLMGKDIAHMNVRRLLHRISSLNQNDSLERAIHIITHNGTRSAPVLKNNEIIGVVEAKNILKIIPTIDNKWIKANQIFTPDPIVIDKKTLLGTARKIMTIKRFDHLPVVDGDKISQVLTSFHVLQTILPQQRTGKKGWVKRTVHRDDAVVGNIGTSRIVRCEPLDDLGSVVKAMLYSDTTFCLVSLRDRLQGIITYRDILNLLGTKIKSKIPLFIIGMPEEENNTDIVIDKFTKTLEFVQKISDIQEAKVYIKKHRGTGIRYNYDVSTIIITPHKRYQFSSSGHDLSRIFDELGQKMHRALSKRIQERYKISVRKMA